MKNAFLTVPIIIALLFPALAVAHEHQQFRFNDAVYEITIGSLNEPISVDDKTGIDLRVVRLQSEGSDGHDHNSATGTISGLEETLKVELIAGDASKVMDIVPVYNTPGSYKNAFYPTVATTLSYRIFGTIDDTPIDFTATCTPAGHAQTEEDTKEVQISDAVTRILKTGSFGCPMEKEGLGFPEQSATVAGLDKSSDDIESKANAGIGLGVLSLLVAGFALFAKRRPH